MSMRQSISVSGKLCRACRALLDSSTLYCPRCRAFELSAIRCYVDRRDLQDYYEAHRRNKPR